MAGNGDEPSGLIPTDDYSRELDRALGHPEAVVSRSTVTTRSFYGDSQDWIITTVRVEGRDTAFVQRIDASGGIRIVLPEGVMKALTRQRQGTTKKVRRKVGKRVAADRMAQGWRPSFGGKRKRKAAKK